MTIEALPLRLLAFVALVGAILWPLEHLFPRVAPRITPRAWLVDFGWLALGALTLHVVVRPLVAGNGSTEPARVVLAFLGAELMAYATHRAMHELPWLARFHAVHHTHDTLDWLKAWRQHPVDVALHAFAVAIPGLLLGGSWAQFGTIILLRRVWTGLLHANVRLRFGWLEEVVATPHFHHMHHHRPRVNYAGLLPVIDRLFGTHAGRESI